MLLKQSHAIEYESVVTATRGELGTRGTQREKGQLTLQKQHGFP